MNKNQHERREHAINPWISQEEIDRKWRLYTEEQERMKFMEIMANFNRSMTPSAPIGSGPLYPPEMFVTTWNTTLTSSGSTALNQIKLPLISTGLYYFFVDWGDGTSAVINSYNQVETTHTYSSPDVYIVKIVGTCHGWQFNNSGDRLKLLNVKQWGTSFRPFNDYGTFYGCRNLTLNDVIGVIDLTGMTSLQAFFFECLSLTQVNNINGWNTSGITSMRQVFESAREFDDNIGGWNTSNVTDMHNMFTNDYMFNNGGSPTINNWDTSKVTTFRWMFGSDTGVPSRFSMFNQPIGDWNTSSCLTMFTMFYRNTAFNQDIGTKAVTKNGVTYTAWDTSNVNDMSFMFGTTAVPPLIAPAGTFNNGGSDSIKNWNTSKVTLMSSMFSAQRSFNQDIGTKVVTVNGNTYTAWNVENVTSMSFMLNGYDQGATSYGVFNNGGSDSIKNWNTTKVTTLVAFCQRQPFIDQNVGTKVVTVGGNTYVAWNIENVTSLSNAFSSNSALNPGVFNNGGSDDIKNWNTSKVTTLNATFAGQRFFDRDIGTKVATINGVTYTAWNTSLVTSMASTVGCSTGSPGIFNNAGSDSIKNWNTIKVNNISSLFSNQPIFNQPINTQSVTVNGVTYTAWNTSLVTTISSIFGAESLKAFNQDISGWNTANVTIMSYAFRNAVNFNQNISGWNTTKVTDMSSMFYNASVFNQNLGSWNVSLVTSFNDIVFGGFMEGSGLSTVNYDALLNGWASRSVLPSKSVNFGAVQYSASSVSSRSTLTSAPNLWTIIDGGLAA
jgi:surface protein